MRQENKVIIIGATSGIGAEIARLYIQQGNRIGIAGRRLEKLKEIQSNATSPVEVQKLDVTDKDAPGQLDQLISLVGGMDTFILCSGIGSQNRSLDPAIELSTVETNALGFTRMIDAAYQYFKRQGSGHIVAISSIAGTQGLGAAPAYSATKRYQNTYLDAIAQLLRMEKQSIYVTDIRPGFVKTDLLKSGNYPMLMSAGYTANQIVKAIHKKKRRAIIDWRYAILVFFWRLIPAWLWERLPIQN